MFRKRIWAADVGPGRVAAPFPMLLLSRLCAATHLSPASGFQTVVRLSSASLALCVCGSRSVMAFRRFDLTNRLFPSVSYFLLCHLFRCPSVITNTCLGEKWPGLPGVSDPTCLAEYRPHTCEYAIHPSAYLSPASGFQPEMCCQALRILQRGVAPVCHDLPALRPSIHRALYFM